MDASNKQDTAKINCGGTYFMKYNENECKNKFSSIIILNNI